MTAATVTWIQDNNAAIVYGGSGGSHWTRSVTDAGDVGGGNTNTVTAGDTFQYTTQAGDQAVWLVAKHVQGASGQTSPLLTVTVNGVQQSDPISLEIDAPIFANTWRRGLIPLARRGSLNGQAGNVIVGTISQPGANNPAAVNGLLVVNGPPGTPIPGVYAAIGDSWTVCSGVGNPNQDGWPWLLAAALSTQLKRRIQQTNLGLGGEFFIGVDTTHPGVSWRFFDVLGGTSGAGGVFALQPEFITMIQGPNDLGGVNQQVSAGQYARWLTYLLMFVEDVLDTSQATGIYGKVAVGTPGYVTADQLVHKFTPWSAGSRRYHTGLQNYLAAVDLVHQVCAQFPWVRVANVYERMAGRSDLVWPNNSSGFGNSAGEIGNHLNAAGNRVVAEEFRRALMGYGGLYSGI